MTTPEEAKAVIRRWNDEGWSAGRYELADELIAPVMTVHGAGGQRVGMGPEGLVQLIRTWRTAFPDGYMTVDDIIVDGDLVGIRNTWHGTHTGDFYGIPPTGRWVDVTSIGLDRVQDGRVVEGWGELDMVGMMQQLGAMPMVGPGSVSSGQPAVWGPTSTSASTAGSDPEGNKAVLAAFVEAVVAADEPALSRLVDVEGFVDHNPGWGTRDWQGVMGMARTLRAAFPDLTVEIERSVMVAEGDQVLAHYVLTGTHSGEPLFGTPATGSRITWAQSDFVRVADQRVVERWVGADTLTLLQQAGVLPGAG